MTGRPVSIQYYRYQPPEGLVMGEPDWLIPGQYYEGEVPPGATGFVLLYEPEGEGIQGVHAHMVEEVGEGESGVDEVVPADV